MEFKIYQKRMYSYILLKGVLLLFVLNVMTVFSQAKSDITYKDFKVILENEFTSFLNTETTNIGTYASYDSKNSRASFALSFIRDLYTWGLTVEGSSKDREIPIISSGNLNSDIAVGFSYHKVFTKKSGSFLGSFIERNALRSEILDYEGVLKIPKIDYAEMKVYFNLLYAIRTTKSEIKRLTEEEEALKKERDQNFNEKALKFPKQWKLRVTEISNELTEIKDKLGTLNETLEEETEKQEEHKYHQLDIVTAKYIVDREKLYPDEKEFVQSLKEYRAVNLSWFSIEGKFRKNTFRLLPSDATSLDQFQDSSFTGGELKLQLSRYSKKKGKSKNFLNTGLTYRVIDNLNSLSFVNFTQTNVFEESEGSEVATSSSFNVYQGRYRSRLSQLLVFLHYYQFVTDGDRLAIHLFPRMTFTEFQKPVTSLDVGLLIPFKKKNKEGSYINAEIFYSLTDIGRRRSQDTGRLLDNGVLGLRFSIPFNINL